MAFASAFDLGELAEPENNNQKLDLAKRNTNCINKQNPKFQKFKEEYYQNKIEIGSDFEESGDLEF